jgi:Methyltransferase domain
VDTIQTRKWARGLLRGLWFKAFLFFERLGLHVLRKTFYSPIQDYRWLAQNQEFWIAPCSLVGIDWRLNTQLEWLGKICGPYHSEVAGLRFFNESAARDWGPGFGPVESQVLHCFIRTHTPPRIVEVGSGQSTALMLHASEMNAKEGRLASGITCIEPYPRKALRQLQDITLLKLPCQAVPISVFSQLVAGDLLFIDSSHAVKVGSDVLRIYLEIIPRLPSGVFIHVHDINLPYLYNRSTLSSFFMQGSQETSILVALLTENRRLTVLASLSALYYDRTEELRTILSDFKPQPTVYGLCPSHTLAGHAPNSIWLQTC